MLSDGIPTKLLRAFYFKQSLANCFTVESYLIYFASLALGYLATIFCSKQLQYDLESLTSLFVVALLKQPE